MRYCLNSRVHPNFLKKADEIKVNYNDRKIIPDLFEQYEDKDIILQIPAQEAINWDEIKMFNGLSRNKLVLCLGSIEAMHIAKENGYRFFYGYPITTATELDSIISLDSESVRIGIPLFFNMPILKPYNTRLIVNVANQDGLPHKDGVNGIWIRPEDVEMYEEYISTIEFDEVPVDKEELLFTIYHDDKEWTHGLDLIVNGLNYTGNNRMILKDMTKHRLTCKQVCAGNESGCKICWRLLNLANPDKVEEYIEATK